jgi:hypothetical protein
MSILRGHLITGIGASGKGAAGPKQGRNDLRGPDIGDDFPGFFAWFTHDGPMTSAFLRPEPV